MSQQKAKEQAKERDGYECRFCGVSREAHKKEFGRDLHAHHIIKENDGGSDHPNNLITVCRDCHNTIETTQANALSRIKDGYTEREGVVPKEELEQAKKENERLEYKLKDFQSQNETLIREIHGIERYLRDPELFTRCLNGEHISIEVVTEQIGSRFSIREEHESAYEDYKDWGSQLKSTTVRISEEEAEEMANETIDSIVRKRKYL